MRYIFKELFIYKIMDDKITEEKLKKYFNITGKALEMAKKHINSKKKKEAAEIIDMVERYYHDAHYFKDKNDYVNAFAALNYAHGWLDTGSRLGIFDVKDNQLFVIR